MHLAANKGQRRELVDWSAFNVVSFTVIGLHDFEILSNRGKFEKGLGGVHPFVHDLDVLSANSMGKDLTAKLIR